MEFQADISCGEGLKSIDFRVVEKPHGDASNRDVIQDLKEIVKELKSESAKK